MKVRNVPILAACILALSACARTPDLETRTYALDHLQPGEAVDLISPYVFTEREGNPGLVSSSERALTVRETPDNLGRIGAVLAEYDQPAPDLRLHFRLIEADGYAQADPRIADVEAELRKVLQFRGYRLAGEAVVSATDWSEIRQSMRAGGRLYELTGRVYWPRRETIRLEEIALYGEGGSALSTTVNVRPGQTLVIGTAPQSAGDATLLLTVRAEVVPDA
ncbi:MAG: hypothetical protein OEZ65_14640 [Gemmatimonadota bacterium]|nr:hypothetical protein [Gemmatimonadota bacterium]